MTRAGGTNLNLYSASFKVPVTSAAFNAAGAALGKMPRKYGVNTFSVAAASVKTGGLTQYLLLHPAKTSTFYEGQVWSGASANTKMGLCTKVPYPWELAVTYCGP